MGRKGLKSIEFQYTIIPVYNTVAEVVRERKVDVSIFFVPALFVAGTTLEERLYLGNGVRIEVIIT